MGAQGPLRGRSKPPQRPRIRNAALLPSPPPPRGKCAGLHSRDVPQGPFGSGSGACAELGPDEPVRDSAALGCPPGEGGRTVGRPWCWRAWSPAGPIASRKQGGWARVTASPRRPPAPRRRGLASLALPGTPGLHCTRRRVTRRARGRGLSRTPTWICRLSTLTRRLRDSSLGRPAPRPGSKTGQSSRLCLTGRVRCPGSPGSRLATRLRAQRSRTARSRQAGRPQCTCLRHRGCHRGASRCTGSRRTPHTMPSRARGKPLPRGRARTLLRRLWCKFPAWHHSRPPPPPDRRHAPPEQPRPSPTTPTVRGGLLSTSLQAVDRPESRRAPVARRMSHRANLKRAELGPSSPFWPARTLHARWPCGMLCLRWTPCRQASWRRRLSG